MNKFKFSDGDMVSFNYCGMFGVGNIVGIVGAEQPFVGATWLVKVPEIISDVYPFTVLAIPDVYLHRLEEL